MENIKVVVKNFAYRDRHFVLVEHDGAYCAIEDKYITDGKVNKVLYGTQLHVISVESGFDVFLDGLRKDIDMDYYISKGMKNYEAFAKVFKIPLDASKKAFEAIERA